MIRFSKLKNSLFVLAMAALVVSCNNKDEKSKEERKDSTKTEEKKETRKEAETSYQRPPIINIVDTLTPKRIVIYVKDSAASFERIGMKVDAIFSKKLPEYIKKNNLRSAGAHMAWHRRQPVAPGGKAPFFFEAGASVNKAGSKPVKGVQVRELAAGKAIVAHFFGPYELLPQGYDAIKEFMKDNKKVAAGAPYEIYITNPVDKEGKPVDPYKVQTDIIFPIR